MANAPRIPKIPPLRTDIQEPQQSSAVNRPPSQGASNGGNTASNGSAPQHRTSKEWYYYWSKVGEQVVQNTQTLGNLVTYGPHGGRPDPSTMPDGALAIESDRGVIYQNELIQGVPAWKYLAGTMWGTLSPDQRPTDLGVNDAGFEFRSIDTNSDLAPRTFIWSQSEWIETTLVLYGTHANRPVPDEKTPPRTLYVEEDRGNVIYQQQANKWMYLAGTMWGTLSPDQRPTGLGANDAGFDFRGTDQQREFIWSGTAWVETASQTGDAQIAYASAALTLSGTDAAVPGASLTLNRAGRYLITGVFWFESNTGGQFLVGCYNHTNQNFAIYQSPAGTSTSYVTASQTWLYTATAPGQTVFLNALLAGGSGTASVGQQHTSISAIWVSP